jgi:hypothetical protein
MKTTSKKSPARPSRKPSAKPVQKPGRTAGLSPAQNTTLLLDAREAFHYQVACGNIPAAANFDAWRRDQVMDETGLGGLSKIGNSHFRSVKAKFLELSGRWDEAMPLRLQTGPKTDHGDPEETHEASEQVVALIRKALADHATVPAESLDSPKGHIHAGWFIAAARQRTRKPTLTMNTLAERLDPKTLFGLLSHLKSHINLREGRADQDRRQPRVYPKKSDPGTLDEDNPF